MTIEKRGIQYTLSADNRTKGAFDEVRRHMSAVSAAGLSLQSTLAGLGVGLSAAGIVSFVKSSVDAAARLDDLAEITGASVEELSKLSQVARISGTEFGIVETFLVKLNKALHTNSEEGRNARAALASIGLTVEELRQLDPAEAMRRVAVELTRFADTGGKGAAVWALTGKSAALALPFLKDLATETGITARVTAQQAAEAEELQKQMRRLTNEITETSQALARDMVPTLSNMISTMKEAYKEGGLLKAMFTGLTALSPMSGDLAKYNREFVQLTDELLASQNERARRVGLGQDAEVKALDDYIKGLEGRLKIVGDMRRVLSGEMDVLGNPTPKPPEKTKRRNEFVTPGTPDNRFENALRQLEQESLKVQELTRFEEVLAEVEAGRYGKLNADQRQVLTNLAAQIDLSKIDATVQKEVEAALEASHKASAALAKSEGERLERLTEKYEDLIDPLKRYKDQLLEIDELEQKGFDQGKAREARGRVNLEMVEAQRRLNDLKKETRDTLDDMTEFSRQAARNIQDNFADNLFDLMQGEFDNLGNRFKAMLDRMVADALAARLSEAVFGKGFGTSGGGGGLIGGLLGNILGTGTGFDTGSNPREFDPLNTGGAGDWVQNLLNLFPKFDSGTPYVPHDMFAQIHQGERILTAAENREGSWGSPTIVFNIKTPDVNGFRESQGQIAASIMTTLGSRARRYS